MSENEIFSTIDIVNQCLIDEERVDAFSKAIAGAVDSGSVVLELGTGSAVLSLVAARSGARKVYTIEIDPYVAKEARRVISVNGYEGTVEVLVGDATEYDFSGIEMPDVVISEMLTTGMVDEQQAGAINNLLSQGIISRSTVVIPSSLKTTAQLVDCDFSMYGFEFPIVKHLWKQYKNNPSLRKLSDRHHLSTVEFSSPIHEQFDTVAPFRVHTPGRANGMLIESTAIFKGAGTCTDTVAFLAPVIVPIEPLKLLAGETVSMKISYIYGKGYQQFGCSVVEGAATLRDGKRTACSLEEST